MISIDWKQWLRDQEFLGFHYDTFDVGPNAKPEWAWSPFRSPKWFDKLDKQFERAIAVYIVTALDKWA